jgi:cell division control protein 45
LDILRKKKLEILKKQSDYYGAQYSGLPSSLIAYFLAKQVNKTTNDLLWLAIVGLTSFYMEGKIDKEIYKAQVEDLKVDVLKSKTDDREIGSIMEELDFHFPLLRHWSLYESMLYSPYIVVKMGLWNENGILILKEFLTSIGISLEEARQLYKYMSRDSRARLKNDMYGKMDKLNMPDLIFSSFARKIDTDLTLTSSDMSCVISAILESPEKENATYEEVQSKRRQNFLDAYEILFTVGTSTKRVMGYIDQYKNFMKVLTTEAISAIERDSIPSVDFNYIKIKNDSKDKQVFEHPYSLIRLGGTVLSIYHVHH